VAIETGVDDQHAQPLARAGLARPLGIAVPNRIAFSSRKVLRRRTTQFDNLLFAQGAVCIPSTEVVPEHAHRRRGKEGQGSSRNDRAKPAGVFSTKKDQ
jgi:hypothetical protein